MVDLTQPCRQQKTLRSKSIAFSGLGIRTVVRRTVGKPGLPEREVAEACKVEGAVLEATRTCPSSHHVLVLRTSEAAI